MPVEFTRDNICFDIREQTVCGSMKLIMAYDGSGRRISKTRMRDYGNGVWQTELVTHYSGIGTEVRENFAGATSETKVVVNMPEGLGRYGLEDAVIPYSNTNSFEWFLKNHLGSTMLVYGTQWVGDITKADVGTLKAAYDYRAFGEQVSLTERTDKVTENFTGKERDDEIELNYFGARYLDPMLGMWISVDAARQYQNPYLYAGNNPIMQIDPDGNFTVGGQVRVSGGTPTGFSVSGGTTVSLMFDFGRLASGKWPFLYSKSVDVGAGVGGGGSVSGGVFFNSASPKTGGYVTAHVDMSAKAGVGISASVTPPEAGDGRFDVMLGAGFGVEGYVGVSVGAGDIQEFHPIDAISNAFDAKLQDMMAHPEDYPE